MKNDRLQCTDCESGHVLPIGEPDPDPPDPDRHGNLWTHYKCPECGDRCGVVWTPRTRSVEIANPAFEWRDSQ
jgi:hypothetical protein